MEDGDSERACGLWGALGVVVAVSCGLVTASGGGPRERTESLPQYSKNRGLRMKLHGRRKEIDFTDTRGSQAAADSPYAIRLISQLATLSDNLSRLGLYSRLYPPTSSLQHALTNAFVQTIDICSAAYCVFSPDTASSGHNEEHQGKCLLSPIRAGVQ